MTWTPVPSGFLDSRTLDGRRRLAIEGHAGQQHRLRPAVDAFAVGVDDAAEQSGAGAERACGAAEADSVAATDARGAAK